MECDISSNAIFKKKFKSLLHLLNLQYCDSVSFMQFYVRIKCKVIYIHIYIYIHPQSRISFLNLLNLICVIFKWDGVKNLECYIDWIQIIVADK